MAIKIANLTAIAAVAALTDFIDNGGDPATLVIYGGAAPTNADDAIAAQPVLVTFELPNPSFGAPVDIDPGAQATANPVSSVQASATGTATFFRIYNRDEAAVLQGTVTDTNGAGDLKLSSTAIISGIDVTVVSLTVTQPEG